MVFELCDSENGLITSVSVEMSKLDNQLKEYLENNSKVKDKRVIINTDKITLDNLKELNDEYDIYMSTREISNKTIENNEDENIQKKLDENIGQLKDNKVLNRKIIPSDNINDKQEIKVKFKIKDKTVNIENNILKLLKERPMSAVEVATLLNMQPLEISDKLNKLRKQGLLLYKIIESERYFSLIEQERN